MKMLDLRSLWMLALLIAYCGGASKYYSGENKPYEFGFNIEGEQHRQEKKDENGLIMGEFGFITADGVYHVTVYATDENGNFKIVSMKNIRVHPYPGSKTSETPERRPNPLSAPENPIVPSGQVVPSSPDLSVPPGVPSTSVSAPVAPSIASPVKSCSHCSLPTTTTRRPAYVESNQNNQGPDFSPPQQIPLNNAEPHVLPLNAPENPSSQQHFPSGNNYQPGINSFNQIQQSGKPAISPNLIPPVAIPSVEQNPVNNYPSNYESFPPYADNQNPFVNQQTPNNVFGPVGNPNYPSNNALVPGNNQINNNGGSNVDSLIKQHEEVINNYNSQHSPDKPTLITADLQRVKDQTNIHASAPGEREGLINGLNNGDMLELLYTFNYTLGFHAHHETGYRNGDKKGYYYVTGRDGVRLRVDYVADSTGYHPRISQEVFDLGTPEVPKPDTEKNAEFGLKGYEFKWLYYPPSENSGR